MRSAALAALFSVVSFAAAAEEPPAPAKPLAACDAHWGNRAAGATGATAPATEIDQSLEACRQASRDEPASLAPRWRVMRALYFKGEYVVPESDAKRDVFDAGRKAGEEALEVVRRNAAQKSGKKMDSADPVELARVFPKDPDVLATFFWAGVDWGKWALVFGKSAAVKQGAAAKIRDYATAVIAMDPRFEEGGGYRVLGRLHHQTPSVPFITGWASRGEALANLRRAVTVAPRNFINRLYLADAMWDYESEHRAEARAAVVALTRDTPSEDMPVEDRKTQEEARQLLSRWTKP